MPLTTADGATTFKAVAANAPLVSWKVLLAVEMALLAVIVNP